MKNIPEWVSATIRYAVTILGIYLTAKDIVPEAAWDQIAPAFVAGMTAAYGVIRTREKEIEHNMALNALGRIGGSSRIIGGLK